MILEVFYRKGKEFVAIVAVRGELGEKKREMVSRNVRKEDATFAKGKLVENYTNMEIDTWKSFGWRLRRAKNEWVSAFHSVMQPFNHPYDEKKKLGQSLPCF